MATSRTPRTGDGGDDEALLSALYEELRRLAAARMAHERADHTMSPTVLVHEAWLRIRDDRPQGWASRAQFFAAAAEAMRRILIEDARSKRRLRRGGNRQRIGLTELHVPVGDDPDRVLAIAEAVERLGTVDARLAEVANLRIYAGLGEQEAADVLGTSVRTVRRDWQFARAWLFQALGG